jgi:uncharacterized protein (DUF488 family)
MVDRLVTVGVYGYTDETFLDALANAGVGVLLDVRQRRGVRGAEYAWANAQRLQQALVAARIGYAHLKELAPTAEIRRAQYVDDVASGARKRTRIELGDSFKRAYAAQILTTADIGALLAPYDGTVAALLCVERDPRACHRSLIADRVSAEYGVPVAHLVP